MTELVDQLHLGKPAGKIALSAGSVELSYGQLEERTAELAGRLRALGVETGDRVAVWAPKHLETVASLLGIMRAGAVAVPINPVLKAAQVKHILADSGARLLIADAARLKTLQTDVESVRLGELAACPDAAPLRSSNRRGRDLALLLYTSGSTGRPKGVMLSHQNVTLGAETVATYLGTTEDDRILVPLPLSFDYGLNQVTTALRQGARAVLIDYLLPKDVVNAVVRYGITQLPGVPPLWMQLAGLDWPEQARQTLRTLTNTGGHMPERVTRQLSALFPDARLFLMYGLTEAFRSAFLDPSLALENPDSVGKAVPNAELFVLRRDGSEAPAGEAGELVHCGPLVAQGYWQDEERTHAKFRPAPPQSRYGGLAVWSGDRMRRGADGLLYFEAREDDLIKISGTRVSPTEIEEAAYATGLVTEAAAFGVLDERHGQAAVLFAVASGEINTSALRQAVQATAPSYMVPREVRWRDELPRSPNGKIDRVRLKAELQV